MDGVPLITQCPIPMGTTFVYTFRADPPGKLPPIAKIRGSGTNHFHLNWDFFIKSVLNY